MGRTSRLAGVASTLLAFGASGAVADGYAGSIKDSPAPAPIYVWSGLSVGAGVGVAKIDQYADAKAWRSDKGWRKDCKWFWFFPICKFDGIHEYSSLKSSAEDDDWDFFGTVQIGYDRMLTDRLLIGAFADFDFFTDSNTSFGKNGNNGWLAVDVDRDNMWSVGGRIGFLATPRVLVYGLAAYSRMSINGTLNAHFEDPEKFGKPTNLTLKLDEDLDGYSVGAGVEAKLEKRLSLKLEYRYSNFDGFGTKVSGKRSQSEWYHSGSKFGYIDREIKEGAKLDIGDADVHSIRAVLSFKLGDIHEAAAPAPLK